MSLTENHLTEHVNSVVADTHAESRPNGSALDCLVLLERFRDTLYPAGRAPAHTVDDAVVGRGGVGQRFAPGPGWKHVPSWDTVAATLREQGPGSTAFVLWQRPHREGHAFAAHNTSDQGVRWIEMQAPPGARLSAAPPRLPVDAASVLVVDPTGRVVHDPSTAVPESASTGRALLDPPVADRYGAPGDGPRQDRDIVDRWMHHSRGNSGRSSRLKEIDAAVARWREDGRNHERDLDRNIAQLRRIRHAIRAWQDSKPRGSHRDRPVNRLDAHVRAVLDEARAHREVRDTFNQMHPDLEGYARRTGDLGFDAMPRVLGGVLGDESYRGADGQLTAQAQMRAQQVDRDERDRALRRAAEFRITVADDVTDQMVRQFMAAERNPRSGATTFPELETYLRRGNPAVRGDSGRDLTTVHSETRHVGGVPVRLRYDPTDPLLTRRIAALDSAVRRVRAARFRMRPFEVDLPKYGRTVMVTQDGVIPQGRIARAQTYPPAMVLAPEVLDNPIAGTVTNPFTGEQEHRNLSTAVDPSGVATTVHELGHVLHHANDPAKYHDLRFSQGPTIPGLSGNDLARVLLTVSHYGMGNPREFVAEVFTGLVYGRQFSREVMEAYQALGGPMPG